MILHATERHNGMARLSAFMIVTIDDFSVAQLDRADTIVFGRKTFEGMAGYWPSSEARDRSARLADKMNHTPKIVVSRTMTSTKWQPTTIVTDISGFASQDGEALVLGSSQLVASLTRSRLLDELRLMVNPIALGAGSAVLGSPTDRYRLRLRAVSRFDCGNVWLTYGLDE